MTAPVRFPRFYVTTPGPCPYLPGRRERKIFTELTAPHAAALNDALARIGFRRSQAVAYRPSCLDCHACVSVRIVVDAFAPSSTQRRNFRRNGDLVTTICRPWSTGEQFALLQPSTKDRFDIGLALKGEEPAGRLELAGSWNAMVSHRVRIAADDEVGDDVAGWLRAAYNRAG